MLAGKRTTGSNEGMTLAFLRSLLFGDQRLFDDVW